MAVIKVPAGYAKGIACDIDANNIKTMGTIAGHDTVLMILNENAERSEILNALKLIFDS